MYTGKSLEEQQVLSSMRVHANTADLRIHGTYPFDGHRIWSNVMVLAPVAAYTVFLNAIDTTDPEYRQPTYEEFTRSFLNKGFRVVQAHGDHVLAIYNHDGDYRLIRALKSDWVKYKEARDRGLKVRPDPDWPVYY